MNKFDIETEIIAAQHPFKKLPFENFEEELKRRRENYKKIKFEFQELGIFMQKWFGENIWFIFYRPEASLERIRAAFKICQERKNKSVKYFLGVLKKI